MKYLVLLLLDAGRLDDDQRMLPIPFGGQQARTVRLLMRADGHLTAADAPSAGEEWCEPAAGQSLIGLLHFSCGADGTCYFLCTDSGVVVEGRSPPLSLTTLSAGSTLSVGDRTWLIAHVWRPIPFAAPKSSQDQPCPVCSAPLSLAPVVQCDCGKLVHLQTAGSADSAGDALNCFLESGVCSCGIEPSLHPQLLPARWRHILDIPLPSAKGGGRWTS